MPYRDVAEYAVHPGRTPARTSVLHLLASSGGKTVSGDEMGRTLGISRPAVWKHVHSLIAEGFPIEPVAGKGYRLARALDLLVPDAISALLDTSFVGRTLLVTSSTRSTNDDAKALASGYPEGAVFMAEAQSHGKGRIGRAWSSPAGGIFMSVLLRPHLLPARTPSLSLVAGCSVARAVRELLNLDARVKWPNDVLVDGLKVSGILCEMRAEADRVSEVVVGIGVNANPELSSLPSEVREHAGSLRELSGRPVDRNRLIAAILNRLEHAYVDFVRSGLDRLFDDMTDVLAFIGEPVTLTNLAVADRTQTHGTFIGIDREGRALLRLSGGETKAFYAGDLSLRRTP